MIKALHVHGTGPYKYKNKDNPEAFEVPDYELLCTILSALMWRKYNGPIKLYADKLALRFYERMGMLDLWDGGIDGDTLERIPDDIDPEVFWAASKIFAIREEKVPFVMIDTDLIVWENITKVLEQKQFAVLHRESLRDGHAYPPFECLKKRSDYKPDPDWNWEADPCNTALAYFNNAKFLTYYTDKSIDFMRGNMEKPDEMVSQMVFAEQRIVSMCAEKMKVPIFHFLDDPFQTENRTFTHLWGGKRVACEFPEQRTILCRSMLRKLHREFYDYSFPSEKLQSMFSIYL